jgi:peptidoglycan/LPS O-acetylase OafA/YrhL
MENSDRDGYTDEDHQWLLGCGGLVLATVASVVVYRLVQRQLRQLKGVSPSTGEDIIEALEEADEGAPLLRNLSSESCWKRGTANPLVTRD